MNEDTLESMNDYILESLTQAVPMLHKAAMRCNLDFDDLYQEAYLTLRSILPRILAASHPRAYMHTTLRHLALRQVRKRNQRREASSLDGVCGEDEDIARVDLMVDPDPEPEEVAVLQEQIAALYEALHRLPVSWQTELRQFWELERFTVHANARKRYTSVSTSNKARNTLRGNAIAELRRDQELREAVLV